MTTRTDVTVDWHSSPRIITVLAPSTSITIQDLVDTCRDNEDELENLSYSHLINAAGKDNLGGGVLVGITATLNNAVLAFEARPGPAYIQCNVNGGNLVAVDLDGINISPIYPTAFTQVITTSSSSATIQESQDIQYSSFNGGVTVNPNSIYSGIDYPIGTPRQPVNNLTDAVAIAASRGFETIFVKGNITIDSGGNYDNLIFIGSSPTKSQFTIAADAQVINCEFFNAVVSGTLDGGCFIKNCHLVDLFYVNGHVQDCLLMGTITLNGDAYFLNCWSGVQAPGFPVIDMGSSGSSLQVRNYNGGMEITNKNGPEDITIDLNSGVIKLNSSVTNGTITIRGVGEVIDNSTALVDTSDLLNKSGIAENIWNTPTASVNNGTLGKDIAKKQDVIVGHIVFSK